MEVAKGWLGRSEAEGGGLSPGASPEALGQSRARMVDLPPVSVLDQRVGAGVRESLATSVPSPGAGPGLRRLSCPAPFKPSRLPESPRGTPGRCGAGAVPVRRAPAALPKSAGASR